MKTTKNLPTKAGWYTVNLSPGNLKWECCEICTRPFKIWVVNSTTPISKKDLFPETKFGPRIIMPDERGRRSKRADDGTTGKARIRKARGE